MIGWALAGLDPTPTPTPGAPAVVVTNDVPCYRQAADSLCKQIHQWTHSEWLASSSSWLIAKPARILVIFLVAAVLNKLVARAIRRLTARAGGGTVTGRITRGKLPGGSPGERRRARSATLGSVLESVAAGVIYSIAVLMSMSELTFNIGPLIASAGIIGVAVGFGAQTLVKDFLSGIFMILEDQFGVGDTVDLSMVDVEDTIGVVESVGLRTTKVRAPDGVIWHVRNGEILRVGNRSQGAREAAAAREAGSSTE
ncbi:MAG TPA: mechanosensitive ion channel domain-containing protein [Sporichthyaceae bacterium]|jgi:small conductance mechanosensitive channel